MYLCPSFFSPFPLHSTAYSIPLLFCFPPRVLQHPLLLTNLPSSSAIFLISLRLPSIFPRVSSQPTSLPHHPPLSLPLPLPLFVLSLLPPSPPNPRRLISDNVIGTLQNLCCLKSLSDIGHRLLSLTMTPQLRIRESLYKGFYTLPVRVVR